ncbi:MAG: glycosyltransferase family 2 protein [Gaiellaceae bacterium]
MSAPDVSAVVVAWNAGPSLEACVASLRASARDADIALQVVVVDNASSDSAADELHVDPVDVIVRNPLNAGYGVAAAQGIARSTAPWILLVNPDLVVAREFLAELIGAARSAADAVATLVPEMRFASQPDIVNCRGLAVDEIGVPCEIDSGIRSAPGALPSMPVLGGSSGCCLLRASAVRELGGPEPAFFAYLEDVDLALRLRRAGYEAVFVPGALAWHEGSASTGARSPLKTFLVARNRRLLFRLHGPRSARTRLRRTVVELGHGAWSSLHVGVTPWTGRADALRLRRYARFIRRSRAAYDPQVAAPKLASRATLRETLARKRRIDRVHHER